MNYRLRGGRKGKQTLPGASLSAAKIARSLKLLAFGERYFAMDQSGRLIPKVPIAVCALPGDSKAGGHGVVD